MLACELDPLIHWPDIDALYDGYPDCFKNWPNVISIVDCFEIPTEKPSLTEFNNKTFSHYKNRPTIKFLISITPGGTILYHSDPAGGNMTDDDIFKKFGIIDKFNQVIVAWLTKVSGLRQVLLVGV